MPTNAAALYTEACNAIRHYSTAIMQMRLLVLAQGLVVLTAVGYTLKLDNPYIFYSVIAFGALFTFVLLVQQRNYLSDFEDHLKGIPELERQLGEGIEIHPWKRYIKKHNALRKGEKWVPEKGEGQEPKGCRKWWFKWVVESGPFCFFIGVFIILFLIVTPLLIFTDYDFPLIKDDKDEKLCAYTIIQKNEGCLPQPTPYPPKDEKCESSEDTAPSQKSAWSVCQTTGWYPPFFHYTTCQTIDR